MQTLYFVQHGIALDKAIDATRPLSDEGKQSVQQVAGHLKQQQVAIHKIFHSGKLRAAQTASIFAQVLEVNEVAQRNGMNPNDDAGGFIQQLSDDAAMFIGHLPHIQRVVAHLIAGNDSKPLISFQNSAVACVEVEQGEASLKWFLTPDLVRSFKQVAVDQ